MSENAKSNTTVEPLIGDPEARRHRPIPPSIAYPADYGLANATHDLIWQYGLDGAVNRLIEMAERISAGEDCHSWVMRRRRVDPAEKNCRGAETKLWLTNRR